MIRLEKGISGRPEGWGGVATDVVGIKQSSRWIQLFRIVMVGAGSLTGIFVGRVISWVGGCKAGKSRALGSMISSVSCFGVTKSSRAEGRAVMGGWRREFGVGRECFGWVQCMGAHHIMYTGSTRLG